jgi:hypothetical protein
MTLPVLWAVAVFTLVFLVLSVVEKVIHRLRNNPDTNYRWGVWLFSVLASLYALIDSIGR